MERHYYLRKNIARRLKLGVDVATYEAKNPDAIRICKPPSLGCLERMVEEGIATAVDGCGGIEPDGECRHGRPSWLRAMGYI